MTRMRFVAWTTSFVTHFLAAGLIVAAMAVRPDPVMSDPCSDVAAMPHMTFHVPIPHPRLTPEVFAAGSAEYEVQLVSRTSAEPVSRGDGGNDDVDESAGSEFVDLRMIEGSLCGCGVPGGIVGGARDFEPIPPLPDWLRAAPLRAGVNAPIPLKRADAQPTYPAPARAARIQGVVVLDATIDEDGHVVDVVVVKSVPGLDAAAIKAVREWRYIPATINGHGTAVVLAVSVNFVL